MMEKKQRVAKQTDATKRNDLLALEHLLQTGDKVFVVERENPLIGSEEGRAWDDDKKNLAKSEEDGLRKIFQVSHVPYGGQGDVIVFAASDCRLCISPEHLRLATKAELVELAHSRTNPQFKVGDKVVVRDAGDVRDYLTGSIMSAIWNVEKCKESGKIHTVDFVHDSGAVKIGQHHFAPGMLRLATDEDEASSTKKEEKRLATDDDDDEASSTKKEGKSEKRRRVEN